MHTLREIISILLKRILAHCGHQHPEIIRAITYQVRQLNTNTRYLHPNSSLLAKKLADMFPSPLEVVFFVNSGSEANDLALRLARSYKHAQSSEEISKKQYTIAIDHAYHGHTLATLDVSPYKHHQGREMRCPDHVKMVPYPDLYRGVHSLPVLDGSKGDGSDNQQEDDWVAESIAAKYASYVENVCNEITSEGNSLSAFIIEGGMSVAGVILPPKSYLQRCVDAVRRAGGLYIADEVQTGFGRLGKCMWAFQHSMKEGKDPNDEIVPDIVAVGKPFGNGMPLAAVITTRQIASSFESLGVEYFNTFGGNPVCCAAGLAMLNVLSSERLQENALVVGSYLNDLFRELQSRQPIIGDVRGSGLFLGIELVRDRTTLEPATEETSFICSTLKEKYKVLTSIDGYHENVIVVKPPMCFSKADAQEFVSSFEKVLVYDLPCASERLIKIGRTPT
jgi:ethanolamine-phosphate phospho-lyase